MKSKLQVQEQELVAARAENEKLTKRIQELELQKQGPKCMNGHLMKRSRKPFQRFHLDGYVMDGVMLFCNRCEKPFRASRGYYHCGNDRCDYDLCSRCGSFN